MTEKRFVDDGFEAIEEQSFTDTKTDKTYYVDYFDEIIDLLNQLNDENEQLKKENQGLQFKIIDMLDFVKEKGTVTREEIKEWWNKGMKNGDNDD